MGQSTTTQHVTGTGKILFMAAARPLTDKKTGKTEFSIKIELEGSDPAIAHLKEVAGYKIDTKTNRNRTDGKVVVNFATSLQQKDGSYKGPVVLDANGNELTGEAIPFFDGRVDSGKAIVTYSYINYGNTSIVRLAGIKLVELTKAPRAAKVSGTDDVRKLMSSL